MKIYINKDKIKRRVIQIAKEIEKEIGNKEVVFISNLKGSIIFFSDILRNINSKNIIMDFIATESYTGKESSGEIKIVKDLSVNVFGKDVYLVEDILDTGLTLNTLINYIKEVHKPSSIKIVVLLDKPSRRRVNLKVDYSGFMIEDKFVVG
ncbi:MAG: phosphoribosyltransferase family protein, partial [Brevinematales bacterium]|nr:phosphoribosyltransferase family protein [Brevinematales bacterium]